MENFDQRILLAAIGFDPDDVQQERRVARRVALVEPNGEEDTWSTTPLIHFCSQGNLTMVRYLVVDRGADGRQTDRYGWFPLYVAAMYGHLEVITWLSHRGGAHEDIRNVTRSGTSPLRIALHRGHFDVAKLLILIGALSPEGNDGIHDATMKRDLRPEHGGYDSSDFDMRPRILSWAQNAVIAHEKFTVTASFEGTIVLAGQADLVEVVAEYVGYPTAHELRLLHQLIARLAVFITDVPFVQPLTMSEKIGLMEILLASLALCYYFVLRNFRAPHAVASLVFVATLLAIMKNNEDEDTDGDRRYDAPRTMFQNIVLLGIILQSSAWWYFVLHSIVGTEYAASIILVTTLLGTMLLDVPCDLGCTY